MEFADNLMWYEFAPAWIKHERDISFEATEQATSHGE